jgi:hypothetical protein
MKPDVKRRRKFEGARCVLHFFTRHSGCPENQWRKSNNRSAVNTRGAWRTSDSLPCLAEATVSRSLERQAEKARRKWKSRPSLGHNRKLPKRMEYGESSHPRSGARMQPTAQAVGQRWETSKSRRDERIVAAKSRASLPGPYSFSEHPQSAGGTCAFRKSATRL